MSEPFSRSLRSMSKGLTGLLRQRVYSLTGETDGSSKVVQVVVHRVRQSELLLRHIKFWSGERRRTEMIELSGQAELRQSSASSFFGEDSPGQLPGTVLFVECFRLDRGDPSVNPCFDTSELRQHLAV